MTAKNAKISYERSKSTVGRKRRAPVPGDEGLFGQHLAELCAQKSLTAYDLAERLDKSPHQIRRYFSGASLPPFGDYRAIAKALGLADGRDILPPLPTKKSRR